MMAAGLGHASLPNTFQNTHAAPGVRAFQAIRIRRRPLRHQIKSTFSAAASFPSNPEDAARPLLSPDGIINPDGTILKQPPMDPEQRRLLWKTAIKAPMYSVGLAPILVSATAAYVYTGAFFPLRTLGFCVASIAIIAWLNLSNDVFDSMTGVDKTKDESVVNLTGSRRRVFVAAHVVLLGGAALLFNLLSAVVSLSRIATIIVHV